MRSLRPKKFSGFSYSEKGTGRGGGLNVAQTREQLGKEKANEGRATRSTGAERESFMVEKRRESPVRNRERHHHALKKPAACNLQRLRDISAKRGKKGGGKDIGSTWGRVLQSNRTKRKKKGKKPFGPYLCKTQTPHQRGNSGEEISQQQKEKKFAKKEKV